jgi:hypothetical protein
MSQRSKKALAVRSMLFALICLTLFSFSKKVGGEHFEISLGDKVLIEQPVTRDATIKSIQLNESVSSETLNVTYSHCGVVGNNRALSITDEQNKVLKTWNYPDAGKGTYPSMSCRVKDILALKKNSNSRLNLVYSAKQLPDGKILAAIVTTDVIASLR